jgi:aspartyl-tRNA(Asn)/glutamyl-tRNA(Gln) amidotransferase subunit A
LQEWVMDKGHMTSLTELTLSEAKELLAARKVSPVELTRAHLERIEQREPKLHTFITLTADSALQQAQEAETAIMRGASRGGLLGIPVAVKDLYETQGIRTTAGSKFLSDYVPTQDCAVIHKLKEAGAILLGKLNMHEWAFGVVNNNPHYGACMNAWDTARIPGGSSGGSGSALAAGLCMGSLGSDTRGSIRIPAALCGIVGIKPTYGRVSLRGVIPLSWSMDHAGPMARTVEDVALLLDAIAGYDAEDPLSANYSPDDYLDDLKESINGWKFAVARGGFDDADAEILEAFEAAVKVFEGLGAHIEDIDLSNLKETRDTSRVITSNDAGAYHYDRIQSRPQDFGTDVIARLKDGLKFTGVDYANARIAQRQVRHQLKLLFDQYHMLLTPTVPMVAPRLDDAAEIERARACLSWYCAPFNMAGVPAVSLPCGFTKNGLPIGLQIAGWAWDDARVLRAAYAYEQATEWHTRKPVL